MWAMGYPGWIVSGGPSGCSEGFLQLSKRGIRLANPNSKDCTTQGFDDVCDKDMIVVITL